MSELARTELRSELARFWKEDVGNGRQPWNDRPILNFVRFCVWIRGQALEVAPEATEAELNMLQSRMIVRFGEYLACRGQVVLGLEAERAALYPHVDVVLRKTTVPVIPPASRGGYTGGLGDEAGLLHELARATEAMRRRGR